MPGVDAGAPGGGTDAPPGGIDPIPIDNPGDDAPGSAGSGAEVGVGTAMPLDPMTSSPGESPNGGATPPTQPSVNEGCACRASASSPGRQGALAALLVLAASILRRRRAR